MNASKYIHIEGLASILAEWMKLNKNYPPIGVKDKSYWYEKFEDGFYKLKVKSAEAEEGLFDASDYYMVVEYVLSVWNQHHERVQELSQRLFQLEAYLDLVEGYLVHLEEINSYKRLYHPTSYGILVIGSRPILVNVKPNSERPHLRAERVYRRIFLLPNLKVDSDIELIDEIMSNKNYDCLKRSSIKLTKSELVIGLGAFSGNVSTYYEPDKQLYHSQNQTRVSFHAVDILPADQHKEELHLCIDWAISNKVNILCLPELSVSLTGRKVLKEYLKEQGQNSPLEDLAIIIAGSFHNDTYNEAPVWIIDQFGNIDEYYYRKFEAYETKVKTSDDPPQLGLQSVHNYACSLVNGEEHYFIREHIKSDERVFLLNLPIGSVGIVICKDLIVPNICLDNYRDLEPDYLFIVSMNQKGGEFFTSWRKDMKRTSLSAGFYVNATQSIAPNDEEIEAVFWGLPGDREPKDSEEMYFRYVRKETENIKQLPDNGLVIKSIPRKKGYRSPESIYTT